MVVIMDQPACIDISPFLEFYGAHDLSEAPTAEVADLCRQVMLSFYHTGVLIVKDPRVIDTDNHAFLDMMERYYEQARVRVFNGEKLAEAHPEIGFNVGVAPAFVEKSRNHCDRMRQMSADNAPQSPCPPQFDAKWRYMWRIGEFADEPGKQEILNEVPEGFPEWESTMDGWGAQLLRGILTVVNMFEKASGLEPRLLTDRMFKGAHLLGPTGSNLAELGLGTVLAAFHYDLCFMTVHGKSRFPGLSIWLRDGTKTEVPVPEGHLLFQAGKMFEHVTGGYVLAGFHEVVHTEKTSAAVERARAAGRSLWRVSSTMFGHLRSSETLEVLPQLAHLLPTSLEEATAKYPPLNVGEFVVSELKTIALWREEEQPS
jgi:hypothetical protein